MGVRAALAFHPGSGKGAAAQLAGAVASRLRPHVDALDVIEADSVETFRTRLDTARAAGLDAVLMLGGDGAAHQGVQYCAGTDLALGLIPSGTGNDLARALGVPTDPAAAVDAATTALNAHRTRRIDLGHIERPHIERPHDDRPGADPAGTWFGTVLCTGFDASVNARANSLAWPPGPRRYDLAILAELASFRARTVRVATERGEWEQPAMLVAVGNTAWYGAGIPICPAADPEDGLFDVTVVGAVGYRELLRVLPRLRTGRHVEHSEVTTVRVRRVRIEPAGPERDAAGGWPVFADGEPLDGLPVSLTCVPRALPVLG
ncbi:sphingosine kinase [Saccharomonospora sp. CUA-673]|uniref:diacylglycerol/lipid kinase family protein n=1 Tax=Saccharomonospora sp. CUA-673 TaxID=1904969 RepID=UPI00096608C9|nr:diacylglycerol kinase family protein [Saccharomonospora sp. CUA-673]OLT46698.1 sphingosine kinase [Saccharomonospora sp. CUA-673]